MAGTGGFTVTIGGVSAGLSLTPGSLNVENQIGQRSTGSMHVTGPLGLVWQYGTQVAVYNTSGTLVYSGYVHKDKATKDPGLNAGVGLLDHDLTLMDNCYKADKRVIWYQNLNVTAGQIVRDLVNKVLYQEGVTYTAQSIASGPTIPEVIWNGKQISASLDWLAKNAGYWWNIDTSSVLWFQPYGGLPAPMVMDGTQAEANANLAVTYGNDMYVNTQYTRGGFSEKGSKKAPLDETFHGNGSTRSFTLSYPVSTIYHILLNGTDVTAQSLTKGNSGGVFYYATGDAVIAQDASQTLLQSSDTLEVQYAGKVPAIGKAQNAALVAAQKAREGSGSSGVVESVYADTKVHTLSAALQIAAALLAHYGADTTLLEFDTLTPGFIEGQMLTVNLPDFALNNRAMLVSDVALSDQIDGYNVWSHVQAVGSPLDSAQFQTFWQNLMNQQADPTDLSDTADQQITPIVTSTDSHTPSDSAGPLHNSPVVSPICGVTSGAHTMVCGNWTCS